MRISRPTALGRLVGGVIAVGLGLFLAAAAPAAATTLSIEATDAVIGQTTHATAQLSESPGASGEISFEVFGPGDPTCSGPALTPAPASASVSGDGEYASGEFTPPTAGAYHWSAHYSGDLETEPADASCSAISTVDKAAPALESSASNGLVGTAIHDDATLTGGFSPTGEMTFSVYGPADASCSTPLATGSAPIQSGNATSADFIPQQAGEFRWTATYPGDANNEAVSTACGASGQASAVSKAAPSLAGLASNGLVGTAIHDDATLTGGFSPTGEMTFSVYGPADASCSTPLATGSAPIQSGNATSADFIPQQAGEFRWTATYPGDANNEAVSTACGASGQASAVSKAAPTLAGLATSAVQVGQAITDNATLSGGFSASGQLVFRAWGPANETCTGTPIYEATVAVSGNGSYGPAGFSPAPGLYRWTVEYEGDANNEPASTVCGADGQASAVGTVAVTLAASATGGAVGSPVTATATIEDGAVPAGQLTFKAFFPGDANCSGPAAFSSTVKVSGNGPYRSGAYRPSRVGAFRWTVSYSGDVNHAPANAACGSATSNLSRAVPSIAGQVRERLQVGTPVQDIATLLGGYAPTGTITFRIYGPVAAGCTKPVLVNTVAISGNGPFQSDPFVPRRPGRYSFLASYSGDAANQATTEPCDSPGQVLLVRKRMLKVKPRGLLIGGKRISIRARLSGGVSPSGVINFRLYGPGDEHCRHKPAFSGGTTVKRNGNHPLAEYLATKSGVYRLSVGYSGDQRNMRYIGGCSRAQSIRVG
jgi:hypothetical protein